MSVEAFDVVATVLGLIGATTVVGDAGKVPVDVETAVRPAGVRAGRRPEGIDKPGPLLKNAVGGLPFKSGRGTRGVHQPVLDPVGSQRRVVLQDQSNDSAHHRCGLRSPRHDEVELIVVELHVLLGNQAIPVHQTEHVATRSHDIRLDEAFIRRTCGGERCQVVVVGILGADCVRHRTNGDHVRNIARHADGHRVGPGVAGRGDDDDTGLPSRHHRLIQRIVPVMRSRRGAEREVENTNAVRVHVVDHELDAANDVEIAPSAFSVERSHPNEAYVRRDAVVTVGRKSGCGHLSAAGDHAGDVAAVAIRVSEALATDHFVPDGVVAPQDSVLSLGRLRQEPVAEPSLHPQTGVDDSNRYTRSGDAFSMQLLSLHYGRIERVLGCGVGVPV